MSRAAVISIDGHVGGSRTQYRDYVERKYLETYDEQVRAAEEAGLQDAGNLHPEFAPEVQWDSNLRIENLESVGVVAEVLFPNRRPFQHNRFDDFARSDNPELTEEGRRSYNRWLVDFCAQAPERRKGQMQMRFADVDQAVKDVYWAKENGLGGIALPALNPGDTFFFNPVLDPIWAACQEVGLPLSQHGGAGLPAYDPPGFAATMMVLTENAFFAVRSLWMLIVGGVFDRFPDLRVAYIETQVHFLIPAMSNLERTVTSESDWLKLTRMMNRERSFQRLPSEYFGTNIFVGVSPFSPIQVPIDDLIGKDANQQSLPGFHIGADAAMYGVDYPHFESNFKRNMAEVANLVTTSSVTETDAKKILFENAARVYDFDLTALQPHIDRAGFDVGDVAANADALTRDLPGSWRAVLL